MKKMETSLEGLYIREITLKYNGKMSGKPVIGRNILNLNILSFS